jgi:hypothetical protein
MSASLAGASGLISLALIRSDSRAPRQHGNQPTHKETKRSDGDAQSANK